MPGRSKYKLFINWTPSSIFNDYFRPSSLPPFRSMASENAIHIASIFVESVLYGIFLVTFFWCLKDSIFSPYRVDRRKHWNRLILAVTLLLFISSTVNIALGLLRLIRAFTQHPLQDAAVSKLKGNWINWVKVGCSESVPSSEDSHLLPTGC
jgi:O-antigen ligase